jgi:uncharacterized protein YkwD
MSRTSLSFGAVSLMIMALLTNACGGGGGSESLPINNPGSGGNTSGYNGLDPSIVIPATENFISFSTSSEPVATRWVKDLYNTLPRPATSTRVYQNQSLTAWADQIYASLNVERARHGLAPLQRCEQLEWLSQAHARDMGLRNFFDHTNPYGMTPGDRLYAIRPASFTLAGENAAKGQENIPELMAQWMASEKHAKNILEGRYAFVGVGVYFDANDKTTPTNFITFFATFNGDPAAHDWLTPGEQP